MGKNKLEICQGCMNESNSGILCKSCIEELWPYSIIDEEHYLVWKGVMNKGNGIFSGMYGAPYQKGKITRIFGDSNWLLSPLGVLKERYGNAMMAGIIRIQGTKMDENRILHSKSPVLVIDGWTYSDVIKNFHILAEKGVQKREDAEKILERPEIYIEDIFEIEEYFRKQLQIPDNYELPPDFPEIKEYGDDMHEMILNYHLYLYSQGYFELDKFVAEEISRWLDHKDYPLRGPAKKFVDDVYEKQIIHALPLYENPEDVIKVRQHLLRLAFAYFKDWNPEESPYGF